MNFISGLFKRVFTNTLLCIVLCSAAYAQFPVIKDYTVNDGLPSSKVYDIQQDSSGYLWIATESGISRFDGYEFTNYAKPDGLPSNSVLKLYVDYKNRVWFSTYQGEVGYIADEKIVIHWISSDTALRNQLFYDHIYVDTSETIYLTAFYGGLIVIKGNNYTYEGRFRNADSDDYYYSIFYQERAHGMVFGLANISGRKVGDVEALFPNYNIINYHFNSFERRSLFQKNSLRLNDSCLLFSLGQELVMLRHGKEVMRKVFDHEIVNMNLDHDQNLWVSFKFKGVYLYRKSDLNSQPIHFLPNTTISNVLQDQEGSLWFSSTDYGLYYVASVDFVNYDKNLLKIEDDVIHALAISHNQLYFSTSNMGFYRATQKGDMLVPDNNFKLDGKINSTISDILISSLNQLWVPSTQFMRFDREGKKVQNFNTNKRHAGYTMIELLNGDVLLGVSNGFYNFTRQNTVSYSGAEGFDFKTFCFYQTSDSVLWLGTLNGLYVKKNKKIRPYDASSVILSSRISHIDGNDSLIFVGTFDNGLVLINRLNGEIQYINESKGLVSHRVKSICVSSQNTVWIGTNQGLSEITLNESGTETYKIRNFTIWDGLPSNEINDILQQGSHLVLATNKGIVRFDPQTLTFEKHKPQIRLESVRVNDLKNNFKQDNAAFSHNQNNIEFNFRLKSFKEPQKASYLYKLEGFEDEWYLTRNSSIRYPKLQPGNYRFIVKAKSHAGLWTEPVYFEFKIKKHYTQYLSFRISMYVAIGSIVFLIVYFIAATFRNREELKRQAILAEQKAVRSQMNPHFIFNSLNSIQNFIVEKDDKNANLYLVIFSSLIRRILEASKHNFISLKEEIETIKLYLELEKFRFEKHFDYTIDLDSAINADQVSIPSMLLQPYLENAIWHGIVPKQSKGVLRVEFKLQEPGLMNISIIDDGIGRVKAAEINKRRKHHKPTGMKNVEERLGLLNKLNNTNMRVNITDLYDNHIAIGTRVDFLIEI